MTVAPRQPASTVHLGGEGGAGLPTPIRIPIELRLEAAARLIGDAAGARSPAAKRMVQAAAMQGIDLTLLWGTVNRNADGRAHSVRQCCLLVPGTGKTAMVLMSHPLQCAPAAEAAERAERATCVLAACAHVRGPEWTGPPIVLAQALPDPQELWAVNTATAAGFRSVGELAYLRLPAAQLEKIAPEPGPWPDGLMVRPVRGVGPGEPDRALAIEALDRSYIDTLDCPELCGLRETGDILDSHRATGEFDPRRWWLVLDRGEAHGVVFMSHTPDLASAELVYLGLSPRLRGRGLGTRLLRMALSGLGDLEIDHVACAVDLRNAGAMRLYQGLGFEQIGRRIAMVRPLRGGHAPAGAS